MLNPDFTMMTKNSSPKTSNIDVLYIFSPEEGLKLELVDKHSG